MKVEVFVEASDRDVVQRGLADLRRQVAALPKGTQNETLILSNQRGEMIGLAKVEM